MLFLSTINFIINSSIEQENNVDDHFTEDVRNFIVSDFRNQHLVNPFQGCQQNSLITNSVYGRVGMCNLFIFAFPTT